MLGIPSHVVSARPRIVRRGATSRVARGAAAASPHRRPMESLENRVLFAAGDFDTTFGGGDGVALVNFGPGSADYATSIIALSDGKSIVGGSIGSGDNTDDAFGLAKLNADGSLDLSFGGGDGLATLDFGPTVAGPDADLESMAIAPDGKIVAVGKLQLASADWVVARFNADGTPDGSFGGGDGWVATDFFGFGDTAHGVDVGSDGRIYVTGIANASSSQMAVARYTTAGVLDTTFDSDGKTFVDFFGGADFGTAIKVQPDGKVIAVGGSVQPGSYRRMVLARFNPNGSFDTSFEGDGQATADFGAAAFARDVEVQSDGKYLVGGWIDSNPAGDDQLDFAVARFNANGTLDSAFGSGGRTVIAGTGGDQLNSYGLEIQQNGKILLGGTTNDATLGRRAGVARLNANGTPDATFGPGGLRQFTIPGTTPGASRIRDLELQPDGGILLAGYSDGTASTVDFAVVRLTNDDGPPGSISGVVFNDANANGVRDAGESPLSGWTVYQDLNDNGRLDAGPINAASTDVPKEIPEFHPQPVTVFSDLTIANAGTTITDVDVKLDITHTWDDDLVVSIISPSGQEVRLFTNVGNRDDNFTNTVLDDEATQSIASDSATAPFTGSYRPEQPLNVLDGTNPNGTWRLKIIDEVDADGGTLNSWSLAIGTSGEPSVVSGADGNYSFPDVQPGTYRLREVVQSGFTQTAPAGGVNVVDVDSSEQVDNVNFGNTSGTIPAAVVGRSVFYNNSSFDGYDVAANLQDDNALASNKTALRQVDSATLANVTSYDKGINGVMVDIARLNAPLAADDFEFQAGSRSFPQVWGAAPAPVSISQRPSGQPDGSTRVTIIWADGAIRNQWLQVTVKANADTGLGSNDVFYFGNLVGDTVAPEGGTVTRINIRDVFATRAARRRGAAPVTSPADHNRDGRVNAVDEAIVRGNYGNSLNLLVRPRSSATFGEVSITSAARRLRSAPVARSVLA